MVTTITDQKSGVDTDKAFKVPVVAATTGTNITLSGLQTIDGIAVAAGHRVLVKDQTDKTENGIYTAQTGDWKRAEDFDGLRDVATGTTVFISQGTVNGAKYFYVSTAGDPTPGSTIDFTAAPLNLLEAQDALEISYNPAASNLSAVNVQYAIDEVNFNAQRFKWGYSDSYDVASNKFSGGYGVTLRLVDTDGGAGVDNVMYFDAKAQQEANVTIDGSTVTSATLNMDTGGHLRYIEFTGDGSINVTKPSTPSAFPASYKLIIEDGGDHTVTWDASILWPGDGTPPTLQSGGVSIVNIDYDALNDKLYGTLQGSGYQ